MQVVIAICRHLPSHYREYSAPDLVQQRHRVVLALEPEKSLLERSIVQASSSQTLWDLSLAPDDARVQRMQQTQRQLIARHVAPDQIVCFTSTWIRAANTAHLSRQALTDAYPVSPLMPCRLLDPAQFRDLSGVPEYADFYAAHVRSRGVPPQDPTLLQGPVAAGGSTYQAWLNGKRFVARLLDDPLGTLQAWGQEVAARTRTLLVLAYSHKEVWEQIVADAHPERDYLFDGSLGPGELLLLVPEAAGHVRLHLPESQLPVAGLPRAYFREAGDWR